MKKKILFKTTFKKMTIWQDEDYIWHCGNATTKSLIDMEDFLEGKITADDNKVTVV